VGTRAGFRDNKASNSASAEADGGKRLSLSLLEGESDHWPDCLTATRVKEARRRM